MFNERINLLIKDLKENEAYLITDRKNCFYFSGINSSNINLIITKDKRYLITDFRYETVASKNKADFEILTDNNIFYYLKELTYGKNIVTELNSITYEFYLKLRQNVSGEILSVGNRIDNLRAVKNENEISLILKSQEISDKAFLATLNLIKEGMTEKELKAELEYKMALYGSEKTSFDTIVLFGENSALPHGEPSGTKLRNKDIILIDFGCVYNGYASDCTRTFFFGKPADEMKKAYNSVLNAHILARDFIKIGALGSEADKVARDYLDNNGYENLFGHSLGHGVGLDIHENVRLSPKSDYILKKNMVFSIEPGVYMENKFGIRIEDIYVLKDNCVKSLTNLTKELIVL